MTPHPARSRQVRLRSRPIGVPQAEHFELVDVPAQEPGPGQFRVRNLYLSVEPAMRGWVNAAANYADPVPVGAVMRAFAAGVIDRSTLPDWPVGTRVSGLFGWQEHALATPDDVDHVVRDDDLPLSTSLGVLGLNGLTAHHGLLRIGRPQPGQTVVVSTGAGAVGSCVGQIARIHGCRTVAITGGEAKRRQCLELFGYDAAIDYKAPGFEAALAEACRPGVDVYFDNTAGAISDAVMPHLSTGARVVVCGTASVANWDPPPMGPRVERHLLVKRAIMQGFVVLDHRDHADDARRDLARWIREGRLRYVEDVLDGIDSAPDAIAGLYRGENLGKRLIRLCDAPSGDSP